MYTTFSPLLTVFSLNNLSSYQDLFHTGIDGPAVPVILSSCALQLKRFFNYTIYDELVKSLYLSFFVIPAEAGIQSFQAVLDSRLRGSDGKLDFLRDCHI